ncbi:MAG: glycosyl hydrolase family 18 protein [bacterium]|nr:glycosyl hydrolase family 18 protein [bacterium]
MKNFLFVLLLLSLSINGSIHETEYFNNLADAQFGHPKKVEVELNEKTSKGMLFNYYGYLPYWTDTLAYANFDYELLTHVAYFSVELNTDGSIGSVPNPSRFTKIYSECHKRGVRVHMTFTLFGSTSVSNLLNSKTARNSAVSSIIDFVNAYSIEGANIDFEYVTASVKDSFSLFIQNLADSLHLISSGRKELYIAMPAVPSWYPGYDYASLSDDADGLFIMGYDYHYSGSGEAGPVAPTFNSSFWGYYAVNTTVGDYFDYGAKRDKVILGVPYYGYDWPTLSDALKSSTTGSGTAVLFKNAKTNALSYGYEFDANSKTPYYNYFSASWHQCWYDDSVSITEKLEIAVDSSLQGAGCWALGYDDGEDDLWNAIRSSMQRVPAENHFVVRVVNPTLNVREGPSTAYRVLNTANAGDEFVAFDFDGYWYKIYYPALSFPYYAYIYGGDGLSVKYMDGDNFSPVVKVTASLLNVRSGPSTSYPILTQIAEGQCFAVESLSGDWAKIILPDSNSRGWVSYFSYTDYFSDISLLNDCFFGIDSLVYQDTLDAGSSCTLRFFLENSGFVSADSLLKAKLSTHSFFFDLETWDDSQISSTSGYNILPGQSGIRTIILKAGIPSKDTLVTEKLVLERKSDEASDTLEVEIFIRKEGSGKSEERIELNMPDKKEERYSIYDITGRMVFSKDGSFNRKDVPLGNGVYFLILASGRDIIKKKIFLVR